MYILVTIKLDILSLTIYKKNFQRSNAIISFFNLEYKSAMNKKGNCN